MATPVVQASVLWELDAGVNGSGNTYTSTAVDTTGSTVAWIFVVGYNTPVPTVSDSKGNTWAADGSAVQVDGSPGTLWAFKSTLDPAKVGTGHTFSVIPASGFGITAVAVAVKPASGGTLSATAWNGAVDNSSAHTSTAIDPNPDEALLLAAGSHNATGNPTTYNWSGSSFTEIQAEKNASNFWTLSVATRNFNASGTVAASFTSSGATAGGIGVIAITESAGGGSTTVTPGVGSVTMQGRAPGSSAFNNVRIREVLVNASGQAVGGATGISLAVWYAGIPTGAPDVSLAGLTTDGAGTTSWSIATGTLAYNQSIFYVAYDPTTPTRWTCARMTPSYE